MSHFIQPIKPINGEIIFKLYFLSNNMVGCIHLHPILSALPYEVDFQKLIFIFYPKDCQFENKFILQIWLMLLYSLLNK